MFDNKPNSFIRYEKKNHKEFKKKNIDSIGLIKKCFCITIIYLIIGIVCILINGLNLGIDFRSGSDITLSADNITVSKVKKDIQNMGYKIVSINKQENDEIYIRLNDELKEDGINKVNNYFEEKYNAKSEINVVTNLVKQELIKNAIYSVLIASIAIIIYISIRFKLSYAISSILALLHDVLFVIIMFSLLKIEVNVIFIAAILTIVGYSINNTIVVFDRIRENMKTFKKNLTLNELKNVVNKSISETFNRALYTTITTLIPVICLIIIGSKGILPFNIALIFGLLAGTYSSILLAGQIWYVIEKRKCKKQ